MILNARFWSRYFRSEFVPQLHAIVDTLERRLLRAFEDIEQESEKVSRDTWERFMSMPGTGDEDPADFAEAAEEAGVTHYLLLDGVRQGMLNLFAAALYHAFEQQVMLFHRREVLDPSDENNVVLIKFGEFKSRLLGLGVDVTEFSPWTKVDELRLVANVVKHAEGNAAQKLHAIRPDLFENPRTAGLGLPRSSKPTVFQPLVGEDLFVSLQDIKDYCGSLEMFWQELADALERA